MPHLIEIRFSEEAFQEARAELNRALIIDGAFDPNVSILDRVVLHCLLSVEKGMLLEIPSNREIEVYKATGEWPPGYD